MLVTTFIVASIDARSNREFVHHIGNDSRVAFQYYVTYRQDAIGRIELRKFTYEIPEGK